MSFIRIVAVLLITISFSSGVHSRGTFTGTIEKITSSDSVSNVFVNGTISPVSGETIPGCSTRDDYFTLAPEQKNQLAIALTALASGSQIKINGKGQCNNSANVEDVGSLTVIGQ